MAGESFRFLAGECTVTFASDATDGGPGETPAEPREERGQVVVLQKPDGTVLVHDRDGYRPVAWLTRADAVSWTRSGTAPAISAVEGDRRLEVICHEEHGRGSYSASPAGRPVGECPDCGGVLVRVTGAVRCLDCEAAHGIPRDATVTGEGCGACGLPTMRVERGDAFRVCVDRGCESLDDAVRAGFDRAWPCPTCGADLRIIRRGGLLAGCERYPDCEAAFAIPAGTVVGECGECGLPVFDTAGGRRCLDATCEEVPAQAAGAERADR